MCKNIADLRKQSRLHRYDLDRMKSHYESRKQTVSVILEPNS